MSLFFFFWVYFMQPKMLDNNTCPVINEKLLKNGGLSLLPLINRGWLAHNPQVSAIITINHLPLSTTRLCFFLNHDWLPVNH